MLLFSDFYFSILKPVTVVKYSQTSECQRIFSRTVKKEDVDNTIGHFLDLALTWG